ncbi:MAG: tRNA (guanosine(37)-N1)-methyltransferase TrmD, partial [Trichodesmium sp. St5_bin2_1]|nr:tRNA (guanosine(37)-N1)-methyltransferase TrmD [Trichodesmium sp. St5_bin2_1]
MQFDVITLFPDFFTTPLNSGLLGKAFDKKIAKVNLVNPRDYTTDKY